MTFKAVVALVVLLAIDMFFFLGQTAVTEVNPGGLQFYNYEGGLIHNYDAGNQTIPTDTILPTGSASVSPTTGNVFTDIFTSIKETLLDIPVLGTILQIVFAVPIYVGSTGLPAGAKFAINAFFYAVLGFILVSFIWGRE